MRRCVIFFWKIFRAPLRPCTDSHRDKRLPWIFPLFFADFPVFSRLLPRIYNLPLRNKLAEYGSFVPLERIVRLGRWIAVSLGILGRSSFIYTIYYPESFLIFPLSGYLSKNPPKMPLFPRNFPNKWRFPCGICNLLHKKQNR